ncbi:MAG: bleomycin hydrolase [Anaerophaga sp.]|jgi:bleomycin hydrolase|uniref:aminopeptidase C n=1 Tax=Anaerophaga thermohalophila TaxID=177400 RepID=UPI0002E470FF|nr:C1 family peptidase [Anaerophaga thermohalophila]MDK2843131.1 bleomycin hydrolase [Anaerophaga sp.]MDN5291747.1 bleomycin hydrolase [Anaerophaga sp.]
MNKVSQIFIFFLLLSGTISTFAQDEKKEEQKPEGYKFETIIDLPATSVKDQHRSGTCWSFSGVSFLESEMIRMGKEPVDFSEMFIVRHCYADKAEKYVRLHGHLNFGPGGAFHDVLYVLKNYGAVPENVYPGLDYGTEKHVHMEMDEVLKNYVDGVIENKNRELTTAWHQGFEGILDAYLGELPSTFEYKGKEYTPESFAKEVTGLNPDNYIQVTSFTHHPFYEPFIIELPDNWLWGEVYNVTLQEMTDIINHSLEAGYTVGWATDVSEKGFSHKNGVAVVPADNIEELSDTERSRWEELTEEERQKQMYSFEGPVTEKKITQEIRQEGFDEYTTTDDHGMHIVGLVKDQNGTTYYKVKNSWNTDNKYNGYLYASESFVKLKTISLMVNKEALPKSISKKLGL